LDNIPVAVGFTNAQGGVVLDNGILASIWRGSHELNTVSDYQEYKAWWPETQERVKANEWPSARALNGEGSTAAFDIQKFDGTMGTIVVSAKPILDIEGAVAGTIWMNQDITDIKRAQHAVEEERDRLISLINSISDEVWVADAQGKLVMVNPAVTKEFDLKVGPDGIEVGKVVSSFEVLRPDGSERPPEEAPPSRALKGEFIVGQEEIVRSPSSGEFRVRQVNAAPIKNNNGDILGSVSVVRDITDQKRMEDELRRSNHELQQFAYLSSHDLQEPLRMIVSYMSLLERKYKDELAPEAQEYLRNALEGGTRMRELIDDLLEYSRLETNAKAFATVNMREVVENAIKVLKVPIEESKADVYIEPMPTITADGSQLQQVMQNLISNSLKFHGPERSMVHISASRGIKEWVFSVKDNGIGLNVEYSDKIFQMFQRLHTRDQYPGTGVGLAIVKKIVERHGGRIWVESEEGMGATFFFTIPTTQNN
jgi:signal transduction histidine kinase